MNWQNIFYAALLIVFFSSSGQAVTRTVTNCADSGAGSLRQAITDAAAGDQIVFDITLANAGYSPGESGPGLVTTEAGSNWWYRIVLRSGLPDITVNNLTIDGSTQTREAENSQGPQVEVRASVEAYTIVFHVKGDNNVIQGLAVNKCGPIGGRGGASIIINDSDGNIIKGCYVGLSASGDATAPLTCYDGIYLVNDSNNNYIGDGTSAGRNVISGNYSSGVYLYSGSGNTSNRILGNYIGTDRTGAIDLSGAQNGVVIYNVSGNHVGDGTVGGRNIISGNEDGVYIYSDASTNEVKGNYIGVNASGSGLLGNEYYGVILSSGAFGNIIGGTDSGDRNIISGNNLGIYISNSNSNEVLGNYIGLNAAGTAKIANNYGVRISGTSVRNKIGNGTVGGRNVISGNSNHGVYLYGSSSNEVLGNYIGLSPNGLSSIGNTVHGVGLYNGTHHNYIGDGTTGGRNVISGNQMSGIAVVSSDNNYIMLNYIGLGSDGQTNVKNEHFGVYSLTGSHDNYFYKNTVAYNGNSTYPNGIQIKDSNTTHETISQNSIFENFGEGIKLYLDSNLGIPSPEVITNEYNQTAGALRVTGSASPNATVEFFKAYGDEGITYLGALSADSSGAFNGTITYSGLLSGDYLTATQTGQLGDTSQFSASMEVLVVTSTKEYSSSDLGIPGMTITIPAGASATDPTIAVTEVASPGNPPVGYMIGGKVYDIVSSITSFTLPVTVTMPINGPLADPRVYYWTGSGWSRDGIVVVSYTDASITFTTTHFTIFAPIGALSSNVVRFGPNPYNPNSGAAAKIWYWLDSAAATSIYIVDLTGTIVWQNSWAAGVPGGSAGENNIDFDGKDKWGSVLGDGVYLYKIVQGGKIVGGGKMGIVK